MRLKGKTAILTGAAGAIGAATAHEMAIEGANLVLVDRDPEGLRALASALPEATTLVLEADVTLEADNRRMAQAAHDRFGGIDVFFANAGIEGRALPMADCPEATYRQVMDVNVLGVFLGLQQVLPRMREGGSVVLTSSIMGLAGAPRNAAYSASKHAVVGLMRSAAIEAAPRRVRVNSIHPGMVDSPMLRRLLAQHPDPAQIEERMLARTKLGGFVQPRDIAQAVVFLASDESRMITSQTLVNDGGLLD